MGKAVLPPRNVITKPGKRACQAGAEMVQGEGAGQGTGKSK